MLSALLPPDPEVRGWRPSRGGTLWLITSLSLVLLPHAARMPLWVSALFALLVVWCVAKPASNHPRPSWFLTLIGIGVLPAVFVTFGTVLGRHAGVGMLTLLAGMKLLETRNLRDVYVVSGLGFFLLITNFLFSTTIASGLYTLAVATVMTATLVVINTDEGSARTLVVLRRAARLLAQALPLALAMFILFPRWGPLWGVPEDAHTQARSGLGDSMSPGNISSLSLSDAVAFRVEFHGLPPATNELYWRGPVLWRTDGESWYVARDQRSSAEPVRLAPSAGAIDYTVTLEPHQRRWLYALDVPATIPLGSSITRDMQLHATKNVTERKRYAIRSNVRYRPSTASAKELERALALPRVRHQRTRRLAERWRAELGEERAIVDRALAYFRDQPFYYTLKPGLLARDPVDEFVFETRRGFCEHYATAFAVMMRAAGIPVRIVTGYQGGELNSLGRYVIVRQRDAHAWTEVWLDGAWMRVDPTAAVSPSRIERGMDAAIPPEFGPAGLGVTASEPLRQLWRHVRHSFDTANHAWNTWVLDYRAARQRALLARLGLNPDSTAQAAVALVGLLALALLGLGWWLNRTQRSRDPVARAYERYTARLARSGLELKTGEGPLDLAARVRQVRPELADASDRITALYVAIRYAETTSNAQALVRAVADFRPRASKRNELGIGSSNTVPTATETAAP